MNPDASEALPFEPAIRRIASFLVPRRGQIDHSARDQDDYQAELRIEQWEAQQGFQGRYGFCSPWEHKYVLKSLWNLSKTNRRQQRRCRAAQEFLREWDQQEVLDEPSRWEARQLLRRLREALSPQEWEVLLRVGQAGGVVAAHGTDDGNLDTFRSRVRRLRERARVVLREEL